MEEARKPSWQFKAGSRRARMLRYLLPLSSFLMLIFDDKVAEYLGILPLNAVLLSNIPLIIFFVWTEVWRRI
jgi:hypothetical protein